MITASLTPGVAGNISGYAPAGPAITTEGMQFGQFYMNAAPGYWLGIGQPARECHELLLPTTDIPQTNVSNAGRRIARPRKRPGGRRRPRGQLSKEPGASDDGDGCDIIESAIDSEARIGEAVSRRRFQKGSRAGTLWLGSFSEYVINSRGAERRKRKGIVLGPVHNPDGSEMRKREAQRLLQPYLDRVNSAIASPAREKKSATFEEFAHIWERDNLSLSKPSTQSGMRGQVKKLKAAFGKKDMRQIDVGDLQRVIAKMNTERLSPKTIRNLWATARLIWEAALNQKYVDQVLPKPKLPRGRKPTPRYFLLDEIGLIIANSQDDLRCFYWLAAETGLRLGELLGLKLSDIEGDKLHLKRSIWGGRVQDPKTSNAIRTIALSPQLVSLLWLQIARQQSKGHEFLFSAKNGSPWDGNLLRSRKFYPLQKRLGIKQAGYHAFRHFNTSLLLNSLVPLKVVQERLGHALTGSFTLDVYGH